MTIRAARIDANGVYLGMEELASEEELTPLHLPKLGECDNPPGEYLWIPEPITAANPHGGAFQSIAWLNYLRAIAAKEEEVRIRRAERQRLRAMPIDQARAERARLKALSPAEHQAEMERLHGTKASGR